MPITRAGKLSSNSKLDKKVIDSFTIRGTRKVVQAGDCVLMRPPKSGKPSYVARVEKIELHVEKNEVKVHCRWYYRPEDSPKGRKKFYGAKELFLSDHFDVQSAETIEGKCIVHTYDDYTESERVGAHDYFCRFEYKVATAKLTPDWVDVYCTCEQPHNPDKLMVQCEECNDWYHPACIGMTIGEIKKLEHYTCSECNSESSSECSSDEDIDDVEVVAPAPKRRRIG